MGSPDWRQDADSHTENLSRDRERGGFSGGFELQVVAGDARELRNAESCAMYQDQATIPDSR